MLWLATAIVHHANKVRAEPVRDQGRRASSIERLDRHRHDRAVVRVPGGARSGLGEAARVAGSARDQLPPRPTCRASTSRSCVSSAGCRAIRAEPRTRTRSTTRPAPSASARPRRSGGRSPIATSPATSRFPSAVARLPWSGTRSSTRAPCWEALLDPMTRELGEVLWIVDLNRQSLDRVVPEIAADRLRSMFEAAGWHTINVKYGRLLEELFERAGGDRAAAPHRRDAERGVPEPAAGDSGRAARAPARQRPRARSSSPAWSPSSTTRSCATAIRDLGGHDLARCSTALAEADARSDRPCVIFAYTIKGWRPADRGPSGEPLGAAQRGAVRASSPASSGPTPRIPGRCFRRGAPRRSSARAAPSGSSARRRPDRRRRRCRSSSAAGTPATSRPSRPSAASSPISAARRPRSRKRVVTVSPDVASSTNLGGWINRAGVWSIGDRVDWFADDTDTLVRWRETTHGQHIELGIAETNLVGLLGELGATWSVEGEPLLPIGTLYDPFVGRALEPGRSGSTRAASRSSSARRQGSRLAPEGGAHQSIVTPSIGVAQPGCVAWEPAFGQDFEWAFLHAMAAPRPTRRDVELLPALDQATADRSSPRCPQRARGARGPPPAGACRRLPVEGIDAARRGGRPGRHGRGDAGGPRRRPTVLEQAGSRRTSSASPAPTCSFARRGPTAVMVDDGAGFLDEILPRSWPIVTVLDGHPSALAFLGSAIGRSPRPPSASSTSGSPATRRRLYEHYWIDAEAIIGSALDLLELPAQS